jgi:N-acetylmuramoyl-L-alanine amidase
LAAHAQSPAWEKAVRARAAFEAEMPGTHTRAEYEHVLDAFRAIYHGSPGSAYAARSVEQVAELLTEEGQEFGDRKSLHDAAGQYEFLAKAYPGNTRAEHALESAIKLLGPDGADDAAEQRAVRETLDKAYPRAAKEFAATETGPAAGANPIKEAAASTVARSNREEQPQAARRDASAPIVRPAAPVEQPSATRSPVPTVASATVIPEKTERETGPSAVVTGIRHWSTASYTRVAIDLDTQGGVAPVRYEAARVEHPNRIFFDLQHTKLAPQMTGKSFMVTDDGFLTRVRAAQFSDDVTRVVLDVHAVTEYSAFLLTNPARLIIDIHGRADSGNAVAEEEPASVPPSKVEEREPTKSAVGADVSTLPPMPVTDGSASFGLPTSRSATRSVPQPRVVISSQPTIAKPVPNSVTKSASTNSTDVAAVSSQPGKEEATRRPTSRPIAERVKNDEAAAASDHYVKPVHHAVVPAPIPTEVARSSTPATPLSTARAGRHVEGEPVDAPPPTADGETLLRALGLKIGRIVIDAGHGGHDSGTLGVGGIEEKDVVLDVALRLGKLLHDRLGAEIVYTRADDTFIPLETRTAIANKAQADLFISVHANSSQDEDARGVEVYYLNFTSDPDAMRVASRENAVSTESVHELSDLVKKIALKDKIDESKELATDVDASLYAGLAKGNAGLKNRGVKKAPFVVLIGANMPSILAEISFVTNPKDAAELSQPEYRERVAESLYRGVARYAQGINGDTKKLAQDAPRSSRKSVGTERAAVARGSAASTQP